MSGLNRVVFNKLNGGLGRPPSSDDYISAFLFYGATPSGWDASGVEEIFSLEQLERKGIDGLSADGIGATSEITVTDAGLEGDKVGFTVSTAYGIVDFGEYVVKAGDDVEAVAEGLVSLVNLGTATHGFTATNLLGVLTVTAPKRDGQGANTNTNAFTPTGSLALGTTVAWGSGVVGVGSLYDVWHYHAKEYFRQISNGKIYVGIFATPTVWDFSDIETIQNVANGSVRQIGVYAPDRDIVTNVNADLTAIEDVYDTFFNTTLGVYRPFQSLYASNMASVSDLNTLIDLTNADAEHCTVVIGQDAKNEGNRLYDSYGKSITTLGASLGSVSFASVHESIAWVEKFDLSDIGGELDNIVLANGQSLDVLSQNELINLKNKAYLFQIKRDAVQGTFHVDSLTSTLSTSDYFSIENNRTIDKAVRLVNSFMQKKLASPVYMEEDGTLQESTIQEFKQGARTQLELMQTALEISAYNVLIDPNQNVGSTGCIELSIQIIPVGVARKIQVNIGYTLNL